MSYLHHECELERHIVEQLAASGWQVGDPWSFGAEVDASPVEGAACCQRSGFGAADEWTLRSRQADNIQALPILAKKDVFTVFQRDDESGRLAESFPVLADGPWDSLVRDCNGLFRWNR